MRKTLVLVSVLILVLLISGCATQLKDIDTNRQFFNKSCNFILGVDRYAYPVDKHCESVCANEGMNSAGWKCSVNETVVCECNK